MNSVPHFRGGANFFLGYCNTDFLLNSLDTISQSPPTIFFPPHQGFIWVWCQHNSIIPSRRFVPRHWMRARARGTEERHHCTTHWSQRLTFAPCPRVVLGDSNSHPSAHKVCALLGEPSPCLCLVLDGVDVPEGWDVLEFFNTFLFLICVQIHQKL